MPYPFELTYTSVSTIHPTELVLMMALYQPETEHQDVFVDRFCLAFASLVTNQVNMTAPDAYTAFTFHSGDFLL